MPPEKTLYLTYCAKNKNKRRGDPEAMYSSQRIKQFAEACKHRGVTWAILSAKYGIFLPEEEKQDYDVTFVPDEGYWMGTAVVVSGKKLPRDASKKHIETWIEKVRAKAQKIENFVFFSPDALKSEPYLRLLRAVVGDRVKLIRKLSGIGNGTGGI